MPSTTHRPFLTNLFVNLCDIPDSELPNLQLAEITREELLMWQFPGCTIWLRPSQLNEIIAKLTAHLPEAPAKRELRRILVKRGAMTDVDADLPVRKDMPDVTVWPPRGPS